MKLNSLECNICGVRFSEHSLEQLNRCDKIFNMLKAQNKPTLRGMQQV